jgi:hypothetical protein
MSGSPDVKGKRASAQVPNFFFLFILANSQKYKDKRDLVGQVKEKKKRNLSR